MRTIDGNIILPADIPAAKGASALIEVRDVSRADAPSKVVAQTEVKDIEVKPGGLVDFSLSVPEVSDAETLEFRVHVSMGGGGGIKSGDLLTTVSQTVPSRGKPGRMSVKVSLI